jgi:nucleoside-diphosphate-sugar epimerase
MRVCIVGGTGNISESIVRVLLEQGHEVTCFNRGKSGSPPEGVRVIVGDRNDREEFERSMQEEKFDAAIDMICFKKEDAVSDVKAFRGVSHFIQVSTVCTYGIDYDILPVTEDHPLRPITDYGRNKIAADDAFMEAHDQEGFPVTIVKPSSTYGPKMGLLRQIAWDFSWLNRVLEGRPILICGDGHAIHQFMHVDDAALAFSHLLGRSKCIGETYNLTGKGYTDWKRYHETAMKVLGREVEMIGVNCKDLDVLGVPDNGVCKEIFAHNCYYSAEKLFRDVPEFKLQISIEEGIQKVFNRMQAQDRIPVSESGGWEDQIIGKMKQMLGDGKG